MKTLRVKSLFDIPYDEWNPIAKEEHRGKWSTYEDNEGGKHIIIILPCGHTASLQTWNVTGIDTDNPSATPSIFCRHSDISGQLGNCWHGYLTNGNLEKV